MSAPLPFHNSSPLMNIGQSKPNNNPNVRVIHEDLYPPDPILLVREKKDVGLKRDVGTQSTSVDLSSGSPSPAKTPLIMERSLKQHVEANDLSVYFHPKVEGQQEEEEEENEMKKKKRGSGCFSWARSRQRRARKSKYIFPICVPHLVKGC